ncbi:ribonuclease catalytic domain-containing protein [Thermodesulfobacteriota bacterium]
MLYVKTMEPGNIVEYIDHQKIMCGVVMAVKDQRLRLLIENNREVNLSASRLSHNGDTRLDLSMGRDKLVENIKQIVNRRIALIDHIDVQELWEILNSEQEWIDVETMTGLCFPDTPTQDHESAVIRAFFQNRQYFKFNSTHFYPFTEDQVEQVIAKNKEAEHKNRLVEEGGDWLKNIYQDNAPIITENESKFINLLKSHYLFEKESKDYNISKAMLSRAGITDNETLLQILIKQKVWGIDENIDLLRYEVPVAFFDSILEDAEMLTKAPVVHVNENDRKDLTILPIMTIDGQYTTDYDDSLSIEEIDDYYRLGVHITDVGHFIKKGDRIDREAIGRGSSIYMPDQKIPMLPSCLAEDLCSLKEGELRPAISIMINLTRSAEVLDYEIFPSLIRIKNQMTYYDVDMAVDDNRGIGILYDIAKQFRKKRLSEGAVQITLPEVNIKVNEKGDVIVMRTNRESPGRMLVAELMIMANWIMGRFLAEHDAPAIFRSQPEPRERLFKEDQGTLFQNWMQRKALSRFVLSAEPDRHSGLGLNVYVTATSPIRKYFDLATQRQIRAILDLEKPYNMEDMNHIIQNLEQPMSNVSRVQYNRNRYWLLKYLEGKIGQKELATVLMKRKNHYQILLTDYMIECSLPLSSGIKLNPEDLIRVTLQHVNARKDLISVFFG